MRAYVIKFEDGGYGGGTWLQGKGSPLNEAILFPTLKKAKESQCEGDIIMAVSITIAWLAPIRNFKRKKQR